MIVVRLVGYIFLCLTIMVLGAEGLRFLEGDTDGWIHVSQVIYFIVSEEFIANQDSMMNILQPVLNFSALGAFFAAFFVLFLLSGKRSS